MLKHLALGLPFWLCIYPHLTVVQISLVPDDSNGEGALIPWFYLQQKLLVPLVQGLERASGCDVKDEEAAV